MIKQSLQRNFLQAYEGQHMKNQKTPAARFVLITAIFFVVVSLGHAARTAAEKTTAEEVEEKTAQALHAIGDYTADQRDEAVKKAKETLDDLDTRIDRFESELSQKWDRMDQSGRAKARQTLTSLRKERTEVAEWYGGLKHSSRKAWKDVRAGFLKSYHELKESFHKATREF
jgi:hypothetical protein